MFLCPDKNEIFNAGIPGNLAFSSKSMIFWQSMIRNILYQGNYYKMKETKGLLLILLKRLLYIHEIVCKKCSSAFSFYIKYFKGGYRHTGKNFEIEKEFQILHLYAH